MTTITDERTRQDIHDDLENRLANKILPAIDAIMHKFMGVEIQEIGSDITTKLTKNPLLGFAIATHLPYRQAKTRFRKEYLERLLLQKFGNISEVSRIARIDRRSIHRFIITARINVKKMREEMMKPEYIKEIAIGKAVKEALSDYETILHPEKIRKLYEDIPSISRDILKELPDEPIPLHEAEAEFERAYFQTLLQEKKKVADIARHAKLRYEVVHRKLKKLGII
jgi:DNA-binding NtrC family response regulator